MNLRKIRLCGLSAGILALAAGTGCQSRKYNSSVRQAAAGPAPVTEAPAPEEHWENFAECARELKQGDTKTYEQISVEGYVSNAGKLGSVTLRHSTVTTSDAGAFKNQLDVFEGVPTAVTEEGEGVTVLAFNAAPGARSDLGSAGNPIAPLTRLVLDSSVAKGSTTNVAYELQGGNTTQYVNNCQFATPIKK